MKRDELQKIIDDQLPGYEVVEPEPGTRSAAATAPRVERPADALKRKPRRSLRDDQAAREPAPAAAPPVQPVGRERFFADPDPRERLRRRATSGLEDRGEPGERTLIVKVRQTGRVQDSTNPSGSTKSVLIRGRRIVGFQG